MPEENNEAQIPQVEPRKGNRRFDDDQIAEIRRLRSLTNEDGRPTHSHAAIARKFNTQPGVISHIVRNLTYQDPNYVPTNDKVVGA